MKPIDYEDSTPEVRALYDDLIKVRNNPWIHNFWRTIAHHPATLSRIWEAVKSVVIAPSAIDPLTKEMIFIAVSVQNNCRYGLASAHTFAKAKGMTDAQYGELLDLIALANETNRLAIGYEVELDRVFVEALGH
jgi:AhpD family alkylhydroperoxidase